jgi:hypothetical protein
VLDEIRIENEIEREPVMRLTWIVNPATANSAYLRREGKESVAVGSCGTTEER